MSPLDGRAIASAPRGGIDLGGVLFTMMTRTSTKKIPGAWWGALDKRYDALLVANGTAPPPALLRAIRRRCSEIIALDGGLNALRRSKITPHFVTGDFDSAAPSAVRWAVKKGARLHVQPSQEIADIEKGLELCRKLRMKSVLIAGADGDALDHVLNTVFVAATQKQRVTFVTRSRVARVLRGRVRLTMGVPRGHTISWFGCPEARGCSLRGVEWPVGRRRLTIGGFNSLSNSPTGEGVTLRQESGASLFAVSLYPKSGKSLTLSE